MKNGHAVWGNMVAYPDFEVNYLNEKSLFWRIEASHPFYTLINCNSVNNSRFDKKIAEVSANNADHKIQTQIETAPAKGILINNYYHEPIIIRNGLWGSRIFLESKKKYNIGLRYKSNIRLYMGLYNHGSNVPLKSWVLDPNCESETTDYPVEKETGIEWQATLSLQDILLHDDLSSLKPLHIKIIIPDTRGKFVELAGVSLTELTSDKFPELAVSGEVEQEYSLSSYPEIAVGIVTYNRKKHVAALLGQMRNVNYPADRLKIFVVDNASTDGTDTLLRDEYPEVTVLRNDENLGGSGGFNRFFKQIAAMNDNAPKFSWLIDDDAVIDKNTLIYLVRAIVKDESIAVAGSVMMDLENPSTVYEAGGDLFRDSFGWKANILNTDAENLLHVNEKTWESGYAGAYSLLFRTEIIRTVGIWRDYFLHVDDCEWCIRVQRMTGKRVVIALDSLIWHVLQGVKKPFTTLRYYETRNFLDYFSSLGDQRALLKVMIQTTLMGLKQLAIKREDLCHFHIKGIEDFFGGYFGKQSLERSALFFPAISDLFNQYKMENGKYPEKVFIVKEINSYMKDGIDHEGDIVAQIRNISPKTCIIEASMHSDDRGIRRGDSFRSIDPSAIQVPFVVKNIFYVKHSLLRKALLALKMIKAFFVSSGAIVILPFWNESVIPNNLGKYTAVFENGQYSVYNKNCNKAMRIALKIVWQSVLGAVKIAGNKFESKASHVSF